MHNALRAKGLVGTNLVLAEKSPIYDAYIDGNTIVIGKDVLEKPGAFASKIVHEVEHFTEGSKEWSEFASFIINNTDISKANQAILSAGYGVTQQDIDTLSQNLESGQTTDAQKTYIKELVAHQAEYLLSSEDSIAKLTSTNKSLARKIYNRIKSFIEVLKAKTPEERQAIRTLQRAEKLFEKALSNAGVDYLREQNKAEKQESIDKESEVEYSYYSQYDTEAKIWAFKSTTKVGDKRKLYNPRTRTYDILIKVDEDNYEVYSSIADTEENETEIKAMEEIVNENNTRNQRESDAFYDNIERYGSGQIYKRSNSDFTSNRGTNGQSSGIYQGKHTSNSSGNIQKGRGSNKTKGTIDYSLKDSNNKTLTAEQAKFFEDSKVRDKSGNLLVKYHGTDSDTFYEFNHGKKSHGAAYGCGFYFGSESLANDYGKNVIPVYLNIKNPYYTDLGDMANKLTYVNTTKAMLPSADYIIDKLVPQWGETAHKRAVWTEYINGKLKSNNGALSLFEYIADLNDKYSDVTDVLIDLGFDGLVGGAEVVAYYPNQIKITTNENPTENDDIRFAKKSKLDTDRRSRNEVVKQLANSSRKKVYSKQEAEEIINDLLYDNLLDSGKVGVLQIAQQCII